MLMDKKSTPFSSTKFAALVRQAVKQDKQYQPQQTSIRFLKDFARNYRANANMPGGMQGYMLS